MTDQPRLGPIDHANAAQQQAGETCCECGSPDVTYRNYREQPFCWPCADGRGPGSPQAGPETFTITTEALARLHARVDTAESRLAAQEHELGNLRIDKAGHDAVSQAWARKLREAGKDRAAIERVREAAYALADGTETGFRASLTVLAALDP